MIRLLMVVPRPIISNTVNATGNRTTKQIASVLISRVAGAYYAPDEVEYAVYVGVHRAFGRLGRVKYISAPPKRGSMNQR